MEPKKKGIERDIAILENSLLEQEEFAALYKDQAESLKETKDITAGEENQKETEEDVLVKKSEIVEDLTTYKGKHEAELVQFNREDTYENSTLKAVIHENWAKDIEKEIVSKKTNLSITSGAEKKGIERDIAILENSLLEQEEFAALYKDQAESLKETKDIEVVEENQRETTEETFVKKSKIVEGLTTYKGKHEAELAQFNGKDTYESSTLKAAIHENWAKDIEKEIASKKTNLSTTNGAEKVGIENEIAILENSLLEQEEFTALYEYQAESLQGREEVTIVSESENEGGGDLEKGKDEDIIVSEETREDALIKEPETLEDLATYEGKHEAELAGLKGEDTYQSSRLKSAIHENWAGDIEKEIALRKADLLSTSVEEKKGKEIEIAILENSLLEQEEFAALYEDQAESLKGTNKITIVSENENEGVSVTEEGKGDDIIKSEETREKAFINEVKEELVTYEEKHEADLAGLRGKDTYENATLKSVIHKNWAKDIKEAISIKKSRFINYEWGRKERNRK